MEDLVRGQNEAAGCIERFIESPNKSGKPKLTAGFYGQRRELLASCWSSSYTNHRILTRCKELKATDYYTSKLFETVVLVYSEAAVELSEAAD